MLDTVPFRKHFTGKSSNKFVGIGQRLSHDCICNIRICSECINIARFGDGLFLKETTNNEQMIWFVQFRDQIKLFIERDIAKAAKDGGDKRALIIIEKPTVFASAMTYD